LAPSLRELSAGLTEGVPSSPFGELEMILLLVVRVDGE